MSSNCSFCGPGSACRSFALMKEPASWRSLLAGNTWPGPADGHPFFVGGDPSLNWWKVAGADGWSPWDLIYYNFGSRDAEEVNWYLYHFVGSRFSSDGNKNLTFRSAQPGIIFTRKNHNRVIPPSKPKIVAPKPIERPAIEKPTPEPLFKRSLVWVGYGFQIGGMAMFSGTSNTQAYMMNLGDPESRFFLNVNADRLGSGGGASAGLVFVVITGLYDPVDVRHAPAGSFDFQLALTGRWGSIAKSAKLAPNLNAAVTAVRAGAHIKNLKMLGSLVTYSRGLVKLAGVNEESNQLKVTVIQLPIGAGLEGSVYFENARFHAHNILLKPEPWELE